MSAVAVCVCARVQQCVLIHVLEERIRISFHSFFSNIHDHCIFYTFLKDLVNYLFLSFFIKHLLNLFNLGIHLIN